MNFFKDSIKVIKSVFNDLKSKQKIIKNRWHLHAVCITPFSVLFSFLSLRFNFQDNFEKVGEYFIPIFGIFLISFGVELFQQGKRMIGEIERFESNKDGTFTTIIGSLIFIIVKTILIFIYK